MEDEPYPPPTSNRNHYAKNRKRQTENGKPKTANPKPKTANRKLQTENESVRFLALGDSYTIGEGVGEEERWPMQLAGLLAQRGIKAERPDIIARTGWTAGELLEGIAPTYSESVYDLVFLLVGVNDQYRGLPLSVYEADLRVLIETAAGLAVGGAARVIVLSIPDWSVTPFAEERDRNQIRAEIDAFNGVNRSLAASFGCSYADVTALSRQHAEWLAADGLHPSGRQYASWASVILTHALQLLQEDD